MVRARMGLWRVLGFLAIDRADVVALVIDADVAGGRVGKMFQSQFGSLSNITDFGASGGGATATGGGVGGFSGGALHPKNATAPSIRIVETAVRARTCPISVRTNGARLIYLRQPRCEAQVPQAVDESQPAPSLLSPPQRAREKNEEGGQLQSL